MPESIGRDDLVAVVNRASEGITASTREKLLRAAREAEAVAVGWWHCDGAQCPLRQAQRLGGPRRNRRFTEAFDRAMAARFGVAWNEGGPGHPIEPFVVTVVDAPSIGADGEASDV